MARSATLGITAAGSIGFDDLTTPSGSRRRVPGGSACYFSLAASRLAQVRVVGAVGSDGAELLQLLRRPGIDLSSVAELEGPSYHWTAEHGQAGETPVQERQEFGVYQSWRPHLSEGARESEILFLGSMEPQLQLEVLGQARAPQLVAIDTMRDFIARDPRTLRRLLSRAQVWFANLAELEAMLAESPGPPERALGLAGTALEAFGVELVVLKLGPQGVALVTKGGSAGFPADEAVVVDPTGAGDSLAGGLLGELARLGRTDLAAFGVAMPRALSAAAQAISDFGPLGLS